MATMNIINHCLKILVAACLVAACSNPALAFGSFPLSSFSFISDTTFSCNDLVHISVNEICEGDIDADEIVEGFAGDFTEFELSAIFQLDTIPIPIAAEFVGETVTVIATHLPSGISCWGHATIEDKWAPQLTCSNYDLLCFENPDDYPLPVATDNCGEPDVVLVAESVDLNDICEGVIITRTYIAEDDHGNFSEPCNQIFTLQQVPVPDLPRDTFWSCDVFANHPNIIGATKLTGNLNTTGSGVPDVIVDNYCGYEVVYSDQIISGCGATYTIIRDWTVINSCTGETITQDADGDDNIQLIKIYDHSAPVIEMEPFMVNANVAGSHPQECTSMDFLPAANVSDNCHVFTQRIITPVGEAEYVNGSDGSNGGVIPSPGLALGEHIIIYEAIDECGNSSSLEVTVTVADLTAPVSICDEITNVSIGALGMAEVLAEVFDDGSYDNCCLDTFLVRRMETTCVFADTLFGETVTFCCADLGDTVSVVFRALDCFGNANDCMVLVEVEDHVPPELISCPPAVSIDCGFYTDSLELPLSIGDSTVLEQFGQPNFQDNCEIVYQNISVNMNIDQCQQGTIVRNWQVTDLGNNGSLSCTQTISVEHTSDWVVGFPADVTVVCGDSIPDTGQPEIFYENCELIGISFEDEIFTVVPDACFKIARNWAVINWCIVGNPIEEILEESPENVLNFDLDLDGDKDDRTFQDGLNQANFDPAMPLNGAQPDGFITFQQIIKVNDPTAPVVNCEPMIEVCIFDTTCTADFSLPLPEVMDCSPETTVSAIGDLGSGIGPFTNVPPGIYEMTYQVSDNCGNTGFCQTTVEVRDCKAPTPVCKNGVIINLGDDGITILFPEIIDGGSYDNCPGELIFSFSADVTDTIMELNCGNLGYYSVDIWVTDAAGNQAFCENFILVDDNTGACTGAPLITGVVSTDEEEPITGVHLALSGNMEKETTTYIDGAYEFEVEYGGDYSLTPNKENDPLNGVTTFDLVLISKHILGVQPLDSPYKIIAADANKSNGVTTADLVLLRKLILQIETNFPDGASWRFVEQSYVFPDPLQPFSAFLPEIINLNDVEDDMLDADFIGIKLGDVNGSADPQL